MFLPTTVQLSLCDTGNMETEYMRKNDEEVQKLRKDFNDHLPIEENRFKELTKSSQELKDLLLAQNEASKAFHDKVELHYARVEPVIKAYEDSKIFNEGLAKRGNTIIKMGGVATALGAVWFLLTHGLPK